MIEHLVLYVVYDVRSHTSTEIVLTKQGGDLYEEEGDHTNYDRPEKTIVSQSEGIDDPPKGERQNDGEDCAEHSSQQYKRFLSPVGAQVGEGTSQELQDTRRGRLHLIRRGRPRLLQDFAPFLLQVGH